MAGNALAALSIASPGNNGVQAYQESRTTAINQRSAQMQQEAAELEKYAQLGLGVMGGNPDGEINQQYLAQALDMMGDSPLKAKLQQNPELLRTITKGSLNVLSQVRDEAKFELAKQQFEQELAAAQAKAAAPVEVSAGATMWDPKSKEAIYTAPPAGPTTQIVNNTGDQGGASVKSFQEGLGGLMAKDYDQMRKDAAAARSSLSTLDVMENAITSPGFYSGIGADQILQLKRAAAALGLDPAGVEDMESFNALNKQAALQSMGGSLGAGFSNADRDFVVEQVPALSNTPEGNKKIIGIQRKIAQRKIEISDMATAYIQKNGVLDAGFEKEVAKFAEENPLFAEDKAGGSGDKVVDWTELDWGE